MRRWEELRPELDAKGIALVAICTDTPGELRRGKAKHGSRAVLLSDADLHVTDRYGLRNPVNVTPKGLKPMPVPTTLLVDAEGVVRWIDQAEDYQIRSDPGRVRTAIQAALG